MPAALALAAGQVGVQARPQAIFWWDSHSGFPAYADWPAGATAAQMAQSYSSGQTNAPTGSPLAYARLKGLGFDAVGLPGPKGPRQTFDGGSDDPANLRGVNQLRNRLSYIPWAQEAGLDVYLNIPFFSGQLAADFSWHEPYWATVLDYVRQIARYAARTGCQGLIFDFEPYGIPVADPYFPWSVAHWTNATPELSRAQFLELMRQRAAQLAGVVASEFPGCALRVYGVANGAGTAQDGKDVTAWFLAGLAEARLAGGVEYDALETYYVFDPLWIKGRYDQELLPIMAQAAQVARTTADADYVRQNMAVSLGSAALHRWHSWDGIYDRAVSHVTADSYEAHLTTLLANSPRSVWIVGESTFDWTEPAISKDVQSDFSGFWGLGIPFADMSARSQALTDRFRQVMALPDAEILSRDAAARAAALSSRQQLQQSLGNPAIAFLHNQEAWIETNADRDWQFRFAARLNEYGNLDLGGLTDALPQTDVVLTCASPRWANAADAAAIATPRSLPRPEAWAEFLARGGILVVGDVETNPNASQWLEAIDPALALPARMAGPSRRNAAWWNPSAAVVNGPEKLALSTSDQRFDGAAAEAAGWTVLASCEDGNPIYLYRRHGRGQVAVLLSTKWQHGFGWNHVINLLAARPPVLFSETFNSGAVTGWQSMTPLAGAIWSVAGNAYRGQAYGGGAAGWSLRNEAVVPASAWSYAGTVKWISSYNPTDSNYGVAGLLVSSTPSGMTDDWVQMVAVRTTYEGAPFIAPVIQWKLGDSQGSTFGPAFAAGPNQNPLSLLAGRGADGTTLTLRVVGSGGQGEVVKSFTPEEARRLNALKYAGVTSYFSINDFDNLSLSAPVVSDGTRNSENFNAYATGTYTYPAGPLAGWNAMPSNQGVEGRVAAVDGNNVLRMDSSGAAASGWALKSAAVLPASAADWTYQGTVKFIQSRHPSDPWYGQGGLLLSSTNSGPGGNYVWFGYTRIGDDTWARPFARWRLAGKEGGGIIYTDSVWGDGVVTALDDNFAMRDSTGAPFALRLGRTAGGNTLNFAIQSPLDGLRSGTIAFTGDMAAALDTLRFAGVMNYLSVFDYDDLDIVNGPLISATGTPAALTAVYGTASPATQFTVSGLNMGAGILVTPPAGFEVSTDNTHFASTVTVGAGGAIPDTTVYLRLAATATAGARSGNIVLSGGGATPMSTVVATGTVSPRQVDNLILDFNSYSAGEYLFPSNPLARWNATPSQSGLIPTIVDLGAGNKALRMDSFGGGASSWVLYEGATLPEGTLGWTYSGTAKWVATYHPSLPHYGIGGLLLSSGSNGIEGNNWIWLGFSRSNYDNTGRSWSLPMLEYSLGGVSGSVPLGGPAFRDFPEHPPVGLTITRIGGTITLSIASPLDGNVTKSHTFTGAQAAALDTLRFVGTMTYFSVFQYDNLNLVSGPLISTSGTTAALTTTYGTASATTSFTVSALNMSAGILVTPPAGFEVSTDNTNFSTTVTVGSAGTIANTTVYLRLAATASAGTKSGNIVLSGGGSADVNLAAAVGMVEAKPLTGLFAAADKVYDGTTAATVTGRSLTGIVGSDDVSLSGGTAAFADAAIGTDKMVTLTGANIAGAQAGNYTLVTVSTTTADIRAPGISENFEGYALGDYPFPANPLRGWKYMPSNSGLIPAITNKVNGSGQVLKMNGYGGGAVAWMSAAPPVLAAATPNWSVSADAKYLASNKQGDAWYGQGGLLLSSTGDMSGDYLWVGIQTGWGELNPTTTFARPFASWKLGGVTGGGTIFSPEGAIRMSTDTWGPAVLTVGRTNGSSSLSFVIGSPVDGMRTATLSFSGVAAAALGNLQYAGFANYLSVWHYDNLVVTSSSGAPQIEAWLEGQPLNEENLLKYGVGGAVTIQSPSEAATSSLDAMKLSLTAIVRTDDPDLRVVAETSGNLTTWTTSGLTMETAANQVGVVAGFQRRVFSIPLTNNSTRLFLRLRIIYLPQ